MTDTAVKQPLKVEKFGFGPWLLTASNSHILSSEGSEREWFEDQLDLPNVPEMVFAKNRLRLEHVEGFGIEFNALDALKLVDARNDLIKVANAEDWQQARSECEHIANVVKPFDWTFTTNYRGSVFGQETAQFMVIDTDEEIDLEKLKKKEQIQFYSDLMLFEDELHDSGCSILSVKVRVMPTSFFLLQRFYLRVDNVLIRVYDTRLYHECGWNYVLREYTQRENKTSELTIPANILIEPNEVWQHLNVQSRIKEKLQFPIDSKPIIDANAIANKPVISTAESQ